MAKMESAEVVLDEEGRPYHIGTSAEEVAPYCLLVGDPARAERVAGLFGERSHVVRNREFVTITGTYLDIPLTVVGTGIGCDNIEIVVIEYCQLVERPTFLRVGSCGGLRNDLALGDLVITTGAVKLESTSSYFVPEGYPAVAHHELVLALVEAATLHRYPYHVGLTATASGFYGAQGRSIGGFEPLDPELPARLDRMNVLNMEMEASTLLTLANLRGLRAGVCCAVYAQRHANEFIASDAKQEAELSAIKTGLKAIEILHHMDESRGDEPYWRPSHGL